MWTVLHTLSAALLYYQTTLFYLKGRKPRKSDAGSNAYSRTYSFTLIILPEAFNLICKMGVIPPASGVAVRAKWRNAGKLICRWIAWSLPPSPHYHSILLISFPAHTFPSLIRYLSHLDYIKAFLIVSMPCSLPPPTSSSQSFLSLPNLPEINAYHVPTLMKY